MTQLPFLDRTEAGRVLASELLKRNFPDDTIVLALPRGGLPVASEVAHALAAPLDVVIVRKLGLPRDPELAMGAIASGAFQTLDENIIRMYGISRREVDEVTARERTELARRENLYRAGRSELNLRNKTVILVDDGLATGSTMLVAVRYVRGLKPRRIVIAVPVAAVEACRLVEQEADECIWLETPEPFIAVGQWYRDFRQVSDAEALSALKTP